ncbi:hypothetical protein M3196_00385 [Fictibacillus nanhaiensis]|uniref:hypothetical protein n=1 Tax=Fictibacillus nanhaiensis TaxID=742169 RepID=UPI00204166AE|nr:hypothetical protein [Fictibacillus nanhaiensis]MCM3730125.1 hypothetical protein [Fictibacillus nanhaiensis]
MIINKFDVWYNFSTYLNTDNIDLIKLKDNILQTGLGELIFHSPDNMVFWVNEDRVISYDPKIKGDFQSYSFTIPDQSIITDGQLEYLYQAVKMKFHENLLFRDYMYNDLFDHIRVYLAPIYLQEGEVVISFYPQIKIYKNGIVQVIFRRIGNGKEIIHIDNFINKYVNLFNHSFKDVWIPSGFFFIQLAKEFGYKFYKKNSVKQLKAFSLLKEKVISDSVESSDEFKFRVTKLPTSTTEYNTKDLFDGIIDCILFCLNMKNDKPFKSQEKITCSQTWKGMPVIHLIDFEDMPADTSSISEAQFIDFKKILTRTTINGYMENESIKNLRAFNDYFFYFNEAVALSIMSKKGLAIDSKFSDPNNGHLIYDKQIQIEMINYYFIISRKLFDSSVFLENIKVEDIIDNRLYLLEIEYIFKKELFKFGETRKMFDFAESELGINDLKERSHQLFEIKKERNNIIKQDFYQKIGILITIIFGLLGAVSFSKDLVVPAWDIIFNNKINTTSKLLISYASTVTLFTIIIILIFKFINLKKWIMKFYKNE